MRKPKCPKCECLDIATSWKPRVESWRGVGECDNRDEHLHYHCRGCSYSWDGPVAKKRRTREARQEGKQ